MMSPTVGSLIVAVLLQWWLIWRLQGRVDRLEALSTIDARKDKR